MTRQYLAGELSVLLGHLQAAATTETSGRDARALRHAAETEPVSALAWLIQRALTLTDQLCRESLSGGDAAAFNRQAAVSAELRDFGIAAGLVREC